MFRLAPIYRSYQWASFLLTKRKHCLLVDARMLGRERSSRSWLDARRWTSCVSSEWQPFWLLPPLLRWTVEPLNVTGTITVQDAVWVGRSKVAAPEHSTEGSTRPRAGLCRNLDLALAIPSTHRPIKSDYKTFGLRHQGPY